MLNTTTHTHDMEYLRLLAEQYPTVEEASTAIVNMRAIMQLPKGTEYYFSDLHGEHEAFIHLLRSGSGNIRDKIEMLYAHTLSEANRLELASLIYYPDTILRKKHQTCENYDEWCGIIINRLIPVCREVASKYPKARVQQVISHRYRFIIDELLVTDTTDVDKQRYFQEIITSAIDSGVGDGVISNLCYLIQHMTVDNLHIIGDIFDRGPGANKILDELEYYHDVDIQWGNHDIDWIGAVSGNLVCLFSVLRIAISYNNFDMLEDGYGINLRPLSMFAAATYQDDPCTAFMPHILDENTYDPVDPQLAAKMHKAVAIIMFKLEGQLILRHPEYGMEDRLLLDKLNLENNTLTVNGVEYPLTDSNFPTVNPEDPYALSEEEQALVDGIAASFRHSVNLKRHMDFILSHGSMYKAINGNLLYHGCIPMNEDGSFQSVQLGEKSYAGKALLDALNTVVRQAYYRHEPESVDFLWYLWCGAKSSLFGKARITTFERYFTTAKELREEPKNAYYKLYENEETVNHILEDFGLDPEHSHIINGHVPVKRGENPVKCGGKLFVIDGGISKAYQSTTGIAGYTLVFNSHCLKLAVHKPFRRAEGDLTAETFTTTHIVEQMPHRVLI
ncbi:MAG: fructose-1,6-bisphosphatase [Oscillospiraceae bacterium]|nr:fructose-1,6-bisphosphatase [Oscillospiraceae bacterium]